MRSRRTRPTRKRGFASGGHSGLLDRHADAASELRAASESLADAEQRYYSDLFLGAEEEALGRFEAARAAYERARQGTRGRSRHTSR